jgi:hypothetical protein
VAGEHDFDEGELAGGAEGHIAQELDLSQRVLGAIDGDHN